MSTLKHIRSSVTNKRPAASGLADGQLGINTASGTPGLYFKDTASGIVKVGPAHVGSTAPNASPAGSAGNAIGEFWVDNSLTTQGLKYYTGATFYNLTPSGTTSAPGLVELATSAETQTGTDPDRAVTPSALQSKLSDSTNTTSSTTIASSTAVKSAYDLANAALPKSGGTVTGEIVIGTSGALSFEGSVDDGFETTLAVANPTADRTITLPNTTGTVITTGDTGSVTSTMIADGTIVDGDINASASIALSKLATGALPSAITVNSSNIVDGSIVNADVSASAAIAGSKISPDFGNQTIQTTGIVSHAAGSAGAPTITFTGDTNTGVYSPGADQVAISTNGVGRLFIDSSGNVGIGTQPSVQLHLAGPARIGLNNTDDAELQIGAGATGNRNAYIDLVGDTTYTDYGLRLLRNNNGANGDSFLTHRGTGTLYLKCEDGGTITFGTSNTTRAYFSGTRFKLVGTDITSDSNAGNIALYGGDGTGANIELYGGSHASLANLMVFDAGEHRFRSQNGANERARFDSSGRLLVGTGTSITTGVQPFIQVHGTSENAYESINRWSTDAAPPGLIFGKSRGASVGTRGAVTAEDVLGEISFWGDNGTSFNYGATILAVVDGAVSGGGVGDMPGRLVFSTTPDGTSTPMERMRIANDGRVGIGTTGAPSNRLHVSGSGDVIRIDSSTTDAGLLFYDSAGGTRIGTRSANIIFDTNSLERMRITSGGTIRIGQSSTDTPGFGNTTTGIGMEPANGALFLSRPDGSNLLFLNSNLSTGTADAINFRRSNISVGSVTTTTTSTAYNTSSDYRLKENVTAVTDGIARLQQLKPSRFNFIADPTKTVDGFLAHEVQSVIPEAITGEKDAVNDDGNPVYQGIDQSKMVPLVVAALQECIKKVEALELELALLKSKP